MTDKVVVGLDQNQEIEADIVKLCYTNNEVNVLNYMEEGYSKDDIIELVDNDTFTDFVENYTFKLHCTHLDPYTDKEDIHEEFPGYMMLTGIQPLKYEKNIEKFFCCQNLSLGYHRDYLLDKLWDADLFKDGYISYWQAKQGDDDDNLYAKYLNDIKNKTLHRKWQDQIYKWFDYEEYEDRLVYDYWDNPPPPHKTWNATVFNIVTESYFDVPTHNTKYLSEKTYSCLFQAQPFVLVGCQHQHKYLQDAGFLLYDDVFDYSFDALPTIEQRIDALVDQIKNLNNTWALQKRLEERAFKNQEIIFKKIQNMELPDILFSNEHRFLPYAKKHRDDIFYAKTFVDKYV